MSLVLKKGRWFGLFITAACFSYITYRLFQYQNQFSISDIPKIDANKLLTVVGIQFMLLCVNIFLESKKWQLLLKNIKEINTWLSIKMVLAGFASGIFTPAKLGEPVGRIMFLRKEYWAKATILNYMGGMMHNLVIFAIGIPCIFFAQRDLVNNLTLSSQIYISAIVVIAILFILFLYKTEWITKNIIPHKYLISIKKVIHQISAIPKITIAKVLLYSLARFIVYCTQLVVFLWLFGANITNYIFIVIPTYFMLITMAPSFFLADLGIRGSVALFIFVTLQLPPTSILLVVFTLWTLNQVIPALLGTVFLLRKNR